jgi:hypothetical protein
MTGSPRGPAFRHSILETGDTRPYHPQRPRASGDRVTNKARRRAPEQAFPSAGISCRPHPGAGRDNLNQPGTPTG